ncbi:DUF397 domain-containing protein [Kitasatospora sp. NPDC087315]|uniref:DUF397 domain-containing protein n=1 Tax=Kitasatospora sp. NPDC087315 TaxID=3364069 RepID=UPI003807F762
MSVCARASGELRVPIRRSRFGKSDRHADWKTSSYSQGDGGNCVEVATNVARVEQLVPVRDSKDRSGPELSFSAVGWASFVAAVQAGEFGTV